MYSGGVLEEGVSPSSLRRLGHFQGQNGAPSGHLMPRITINASKSIVGNFVVFQAISTNSTGFDSSLKSLSSGVLLYVIGALHHGVIFQTYITFLSIMRFLQTMRQSIRL
jgi:hypothetical protein